jgi:lipoyl(octanoyl) transferase
MTHTVSKLETRTCQLVHAGCMPFRNAWEWQRQRATNRSAGYCGDTLLLLEHPPTITLGRAADRRNVLVNGDELARRGVALVECDRGGDVTYHAPGQLVGYPILKLSRYGGGLLRYLRNLEETLIRMLASYHIRAGRVEGFTGVWVNRQQASTGDMHAADIPLDAKIAAIGVRLTASGITMHGFALNVAPDLRGFEQIIPCGIRERSVTSLEQLLGYAPPLHEVAGRVIACFSDVFEVRLTPEEIIDG